MSNVDWDKVLFRCSCIGKIMANGRGGELTDKQIAYMVELQMKGDKITPKQEMALRELQTRKNTPPGLGETCISYLKEVYVWEKYHKEPVGGSERSKYTLKGLQVEEESIMMLSRCDDQQYEKNEERISNEFIIGTPDIRHKIGEKRKIIDIKSSWDFATLLANDGGSEKWPLNPLYEWQVQGYMALDGASEGEVCYCLVNMPEEFLNSEKKRIYYAMNPVTEEDPIYKQVIAKMENNYTFDEIPIEERIIRFPLIPDPKMIEKIYERVKMCRKWLSDFDKIRTERLTKIK